MALYKPQVDKVLALSLSLGGAFGRDKIKSGRGQRLLLLFIDKNSIAVKQLLVYSFSTCGLLIGTKFYN